MIVIAKIRTVYSTFFPKKRPSSNKRTSTFASRSSSKSSSTSNHRNRPIWLAAKATKHHQCTSIPSSSHQPVSSSATSLQSPTHPLAPVSGSNEQSSISSSLSRSHRRNSETTIASNPASKNPWRRSCRPAARRAQEARLRRVVQPVVRSVRYNWVWKHSFYNLYPH
ncbi:unnamed protein product [Protopolystoma xenopodis]|uniref:Uncharacterized protein n=1 Tax=Protopolystoma xenopodis TaxID=117903 RepID=A0A448WZP0_9PLAT|nr:unnamed protein product [Protopolystoma xenopodis]